MDRKKTILVVGMILVITTLFIGIVYLVEKTNIEPNPINATVVSVQEVQVIIPGLGSDTVANFPFATIKTDKVELSGIVDMTTLKVGDKIAVVYDKEKYGGILCPPLCKKDYLGYQWFKIVQIFRANQS